MLPMITEKRYLALLGMLLLTLLLRPLIPVAPVIAIVVNVAALVVVFAAMQAVWTHPRTKIVAVALGLAGWSLSTAGPGLRVVGGSLTLAFLLLILVSVLIDVLRAEEVVADTVMGAACAYILMGLAWADVFAIVETLRPGSIAMPAAVLSDPRARDGQIVYFSFITLTTVGYGDMTPASPATRVLAMVEGLTGQLYVAILIARMVGLHTARGSASRRS